MSAMSLVLQNLGSDVPLKEVVIGTVRVSIPDTAEEEAVAGEGIHVVVVGDDVPIHRTVAEDAGMGILYDIVGDQVVRAGVINPAGIISHISLAWVIYIVARDIP